MAGMDAGMMDEEYGDEEDEGSSDFGNPFEAFASNPGFQELRARILQSPQFYQEFMQMLQTSQPQLYEAIQANPQAFMNLLLGGGMGGMGGGHGHSHGQGLPGAGQARQGNPAG